MAYKAYMYFFREFKRLINLVPHLTPGLLGETFKDYPKNWAKMVGKCGDFCGGIGRKEGDVKGDTTDSSTMRTCSTL